MNHHDQVEVDENGFENLYRRHAPLLWGLSYRITGCAADADDIVQETFARAAQVCAATPPESWRSWLVRVATNLALDLLRRRKRRAYRGTWLPSPIDGGGEAAAAIDCIGQSVDARYEQV